MNDFASTPRVPSASRLAAASAAHCSGVESREYVTPGSAARIAPDGTPRERFSLVRNGGRAAAAASFLTFIAMLGPDTAAAAGHTSEVNGFVSGETVSGAVAVQNVQSGGQAVSGTITNSGVQNVSSGGRTSAMIVQSNGWQEVFSGGVATSTAVISGGTQDVYSGGSATHTTVHAGGTQYLHGSATLSGTVINSGGSQEIHSGYSASAAELGGVTYTSGATQVVRRNASMDGFTVNDGVTQSVSGSALRTVVNSGGTQAVTNFGSATGTVVNSGGTQSVGDYSTATGTIVSAGGIQDVARTARVLSGQIYGTQNITGFTGSAGLSVEDTIHFGGVQNVNPLGQATSAKVNSGGVQNVNSDGKAIGTVVSAGGIQNVKGLGQASSGQIYGTQEVLAGVGSAGLSVDDTIHVGGVQNVRSGGRAEGTAIYGTQTLHGSAGLTDITVHSGGVQEINYDAGASDISSVTYSSGATQRVLSGAAMSSFTVGNGVTQDVSGLADSTQVNSGGRQNVRGGGEARDTTVSAGGSQVVEAGATIGLADIHGTQTLNGSAFYNGSSGPSIHSGGVQEINYSAQASHISDVTYRPGATQRVLSGASMDGFTVNSGVTQAVLNGGRAISTRVNTDGVQRVSSGGYASGTLVRDGGELIVSGGGRVAAATVSSGGAMAVRDAATTPAILEAGKTTIKEGGELTTGTGALRLTSGAVLEMERTTSGTLAANLTGEGQLQKTGSGTLTVTSGSTLANAFTAVSAGTMALADGASATGVVGTYGTGVFSHDSIAQTIAGLTGDGGSYVYGSGALTVNNAANFTYGGTISGGGSFIKAGSGTQYLDGAANRARDVTVSGGKLLVGSLPGNSASFRAMSGFTVISGGTLGGHGELLGDIIVRVGGTFAPGGSIGTTTVTGNQTFEPGSYLEIEHDTLTGAYDSMTVSGRATLAGTVKHLPLGTGTAALVDAPIVTAAGGVSGTFDSLETGTFWDGSLSYDATTAYLNLTPAVGPVPPGPNPPGPKPDPVRRYDFTRNQRAVNTSLGTLPSGALRDKLLGITGIGRPEMLDQLSGEIYATAMGNLLSLDRDFAQSIMRRAGTLAVSGRAAQTLVAQVDTQAFATASGSSFGNGLWITGGGSYTKTDGTGYAAKSTLSGPDLYLGYNLGLNNGFFGGLTFRYSYKELDVKGGRRSEADIDSYSLGLYGGKEFDLGPGALRLVLGGAYSRHDVDATRKIRSPGMRENLDGDYNADSWQLFLEGAYAFPVGQSLWLEPFANLTWNRIETDSFKESGGLAALKARSESKNATSSLVGLRARVPLHDKIHLNAEAGWRHAYGNLKPETDLSFRQGGDSFTIKGNSLSRDEAALNLSMELKATDNLSFGISYEGGFGDRGQSHGGQAMVVFRF